MKNIILVCFMAFFVTFTQAQNKFAVNRAENAVSLIKANMEISDSDVVF